MKNVIHQIDRNEWLLLSVFQQGLRQMRQSLEILNVLNTLMLKPIFSKTKTFFKKLGYHFLVESTVIENATFPYKTAQSEANFKTNRMESTR